MHKEWIIVENNEYKNNPRLAKPEKIAVLDGSNDAYENLTEELKETGKNAFNLNSYSKYFNIDKLPREYYKSYRENEKFNHRKGEDNGKEKWFKYR